MLCGFASIVCCRARKKLFDKIRFVLPAIESHLKRYMRIVENTLRNKLKTTFFFGLHKNAKLKIKYLPPPRLALRTQRQCPSRYTRLIGQRSGQTNTADSVLITNYALRIFAASTSVLSDYRHSKSVDVICGFGEIQKSYRCRGSIFFSISIFLRKYMRVASSSLSITSFSNGFLSKHNSG